jgi:RNA-directed DNA polymerase
MSENLFEQVISTENLFSAWDQFKKGKRGKEDVMRFEHDVEVHLFKLHSELKSKTYRHGGYSGFFIYDPKLRHVHKANVRDRVLHHAVFTVLNRVFEPTFIPTSFSCRIGKGTHKGFEWVENALCKESRNYTKACYALKCDVKKFFDTVDHHILLSILSKRVRDPHLVWLLREIIDSYESERSNLFSAKGVPIGNLTSQIFANIYMGEFDQFMKQTLRVNRYARYTDDFIVISTDRAYLESLIEPMKEFLKKKLALELHPDKVTIRRVTQGIDFLGYVSLPHYRLMRRRTKRRIVWKLKGRIREFKSGLISREVLDQSFKSYLGVLSHADAHDFSERLKNQYWLWVNQ